MPVPDLPAVELAVIEMTNTFRRENKLGTVRGSAPLFKAARDYAAFLARTDTFSHTADNRQPSDRITAAGYKWCTIGENLALNGSSEGFETRELAREAVEGWINSPPHKENMLTPYFTEIGVGVAVSPDKSKYISVQLFGRPKSATYTFQISNTSSLPVTYTFGGDKHSVSPSMSIRHTGCIPEALHFVKAGTKQLSARYEADDDTVYTLKSDNLGGIKVELSKRAKID